MNKYYDGTKLLNMKGLNGIMPEIFISQTTRSYGKTTWFNHKLMRDYYEKGEIFGIQLRHKYELKGVEQRFQDSIRELYYPGLDLKTKTVVRDSVVALYDGDDICGFAWALAGYDNVKKASNMLSVVSQYVHDEFQPETGGYLDNEVNKFISIHTSIARGPGRPVRYVPVYMLSNRVSLFNPYYLALGITERYQKRTKYMKGDGYVFESLINSDLANQIEQTAFNRAFSTVDYMNYLADKDFMKAGEMDDIFKIIGDKMYVCTIKLDSFNIGIWNTDVYYYACSQINPTTNNVIGVKNNHGIETKPDNILLKIEMRKRLRRAFDSGTLIFENAKIKESLVKFLIDKNRIL